MRTCVDTCVHAQLYGVVYMLNCIGYINILVVLHQELWCYVVHHARGSLSL